MSTSFIHVPTVLLFMVRILENVKFFLFDDFAINAYSNIFSLFEVLKALLCSCAWKVLTSSNKNI